MNKVEYVNDSHKAIMEALHKAGVQVKNPIMLTANQYDKEYCISCDYMSTGVHIDKSAIDPNEIKAIDEDTVGYRVILNNVWHQKD